MTDGALRGNGQVVESLGHALSSGEHGLSTVPGLLKRVLAEESWRDFVTKRGEAVHWDKFDDFVTTQPLRGLGATIDLVERLVEADNDASVLLRKVRDKSGDSYNITGTRRDYTLDRLGRERPDLRAQVDAGELTANAAAIKAGFRPKTITVRTDDPAKIAATLRRQLTPDVLRDVAKLIAEE